MPSTENIVITGASGQLGRLVVQYLREALPAAKVIALVRNPEKAKDLAAAGVELRAADYTNPASLAKAFTGADKVLLISSSELKERVNQHRNVINAAKLADVKLLAYTSVLHADTNPSLLAKDHRETEALIRASGIPFVFLRNGWYNENYTAGIAIALQQGVVLGAAGNGLISSAARADYAAAAIAVLASDTKLHAGKTYELAGDNAYTLSQFAAEVAQQSGKDVIYKNLPENEFKAVLQGIGLPEELAAVMADSDKSVAQNVLFDDSKQLSKLIGRATTPQAESVAAALKG